MAPGKRCGGPPLYGSGVSSVDTIKPISLIRMTNTAKVDLNLLRTFRAVHAARSVSRAAEELGVSQPTVSHDLRALRLFYRDPLFVRSQGGMAPTATADRLAVAVNEALRVLEQALRDNERYDPAAS